MSRFARGKERSRDTAYLLTWYRIHLRRVDFTDTQKLHVSIDLLIVSSRLPSFSHSRTANRPKQTNTHDFRRKISHLVYETPMTYSNIALRKSVCVIDSKKKIEFGVENHVSINCRSERFLRARFVEIKRAKWASCRERAAFESSK